MAIRDILTIFGKGEEPTPSPKKTVAKNKGALGVAGDVFSNYRLVDEKTASNKLLQANKGWVFANVSAIARAVSAIELKLYQPKIAAGQVEYAEIDDDAILDVLARFNDMISQTDGFYMTAAHMELTGDAFWLLDGAGANIKNIYLLEPDKVTVNFDTTNEGVKITGYNYKNTVDGKPININYKPEQIVHFKVPDPANPVRGKSVVEASADVIDIDSMAEEYNKQLFIRGAIQKFVLSTDKAITEEDMKRLEMKLQKNYAGVANSHKTLILQGGLKPEKLTDSNRDMEFSIQQQWTRDKITNLFGNNKAVLGVVEDVNRANAEATIDQWLKQTIKPKMKRIVDTLNEYFIPRFNSRMILAFEDPAPENRAEKINEVTSLYSNAGSKVIALNEAREILGLEPTDNPDDDIVRPDGQNGGGADNMPGEDESTPKAVKNVNYKQVLRRAGIYKELAIKRDLKAKALKTLKPKTKLSKSKTGDEVLPVRRGSRDFSQEQLLGYWKRYDYIARSKEKDFADKVERFIGQIEDKVMAVVATIGTKGLKKASEYELFNLQDEVTSGINLLQPLYGELIALSGQEAYRLIEYFKQYKPSPEVVELVKNQSELFVRSMLVTDKERLLKIIIDGIAGGQSIEQIGRKLRATFADIKKYQSERVARTETIRASNLAADDAFAQSGVVEAKEWLTAGNPCPICAPYDGQVVELGGSFYDQKTEFADGNPPLHPNCRCVIIPVLKKTDEKATKLIELEEYVGELEKLLGIDDEKE